MTQPIPCPACSTPALTVWHNPTRVQRHTAALAAATAHVAAGGALVGVACETMERSEMMANLVYNSDTHHWEGATLSVDEDVFTAALDSYVSDARAAASDDGKPFDEEAAKDAAWQECRQESAWTGDMDGVELVGMACDAMDTAGEEQPR